MIYITFFKKANLLWHLHSSIFLSTAVNRPARFQDGVAERYHKAKAL
jgi:hypothetical protein